MTIIIQNSVAKELTTANPYAIAVQIEDYPKSASITVGEEVFDSNTKLSSITLQFLLEIVTKNGSCVLPQMKYPPTPAQQQDLYVLIKDKSQRHTVVIQALHIEHPDTRITKIRGMNTVCVFNLKKLNLDNLILIMNLAGVQCKPCKLFFCLFLTL